MDVRINIGVGKNCLIASQLTYHENGKGQLENTARQYQPCKEIYNKFLAMEVRSMVFGMKY